MKLFLDSTSAQAFFQRIGPGRAKHLCARIGQEAVRRGWYRIGRIAPNDNPADLNTKPLSRERREFSKAYWTMEFKFQAGVCAPCLEDHSGSFGRWTSKGMQQQWHVRDDVWRHEASCDARCLEPAHLVLGSVRSHECDCHLSL